MSQDRERGEHTTTPESTNPKPREKLQNYIMDEQSRLHHAVVSLADKTRGARLHALNYRAVQQLSADSGGVCFTLDEHVRKLKSLHWSA